MARHSMVVGVDGIAKKVPLTDQEEIDKDTEEVQWLAGKPMREWKLKIAKTDSGMPRFLEDHITDDHDGVAGNEFLQAKYDEKKLLRAARP